MNEADSAPSQPQPAPGQAQHTQLAPRGPVALIYSPHAGSAGALHPQALLEMAGVEVAVSAPISTLDLREPQGQRWREAGCVAAIAAGGDGTVGAVATHAVSGDLPLGILPLGTANDIARALALPLAPDAAARVIAQGALRQVDAGQAIPAQTKPHAAAQQASPTQAILDAALADATPDPSAQGGAYFLHALTLGMNVEFARLATDPNQRRQWGKLNYIASAIESLEHFKPIAVTLRFSGMPGAPEESIFVVRSETALLTAINLPVFGGRMGLRIPGVRSDDHMLDFILVEAPEPRGARAAFESGMDAVSRAAQALWTPRGAQSEHSAHGAHGAHGAAEDAPATETLETKEPHPVQNPAGVALPGARWFRARAVEIETEQSVELTLDGELRGRTPAVARVAPRSIWMIVPQDTQAPLGK